MKFIFIPVFICILNMVNAQNTSSTTDKDAIKYNISEDGSRFFQVTFMNQTWARFNQSNPGTMVEGKKANETFDIGLRRTRIQMFGQITDKVFIYFQFGQNNFNSQFNSTSNRKSAPFFHDALCEYKISKGNQLKLGGGLTIANGLSRFSQPSVSSIMTLDVPVFVQATVDQTDQFSRKLSIFARGQIKKIDYRFVLSDPFPITSFGGTLPALSEQSNFAQSGHHLQTQGYLVYQFFEEEGHSTPYMTGTYLGKKKVFNIGVGAIIQKDAMWRKEIYSPDTLYQDMQLFAIESYLDMPLNKEKESAISAYAGYFMTNYGKNYLRYNGIMNPANGSNLNSNNSIIGQGSTFGNALPMFGTGTVFYSQLGFLLPKNFMKSKGKWMPYVSTVLAKYERLGGLMTNTFNGGINYFINGHKSKVTLEFQNRPTFKVENSLVKSDKRVSSLTLQYQIFF